MSTKIIALCGRAASGKSTFAERLVTFAWDLERLSDPFKKFLLDITQARQNDLFGPSASRDAIVPPFGKTTRQLCVGIGEGMREIVGPNVWSNALMMRISRQDSGSDDPDPDMRPGPRAVVVEDVRRRVDMAVLANNGARLVRLLTTGEPGSTPKEERDLDRVSLEMYDMIVVNEKESIDAYYRQIDIAMVQLRNPNLRPGSVLDANGNVHSFDTVRARNLFLWRKCGVRPPRGGVRFERTTTMSQAWE